MLQKVSGFILIIGCLVAPSVMAQTKYEAPEETLWVEMKTAIANVPMSLNAHQQIQGILQQVERESILRAARKAADVK